MQGKILVVDAIATNRILLKVKLKKAYYDVIQAASMEEALDLVQSELPDLVICALSLPDGGATELCQKLSLGSPIGHVPVIAIGCQVGPEGRMATLEAGVHDVLRQPVDETLLMGRVRSLIRAHNATAEWQMRDDTCRALGLAEAASGFEEQGHCVLVNDDRCVLQKYATQMRPMTRAKLTLTCAAALMREVVLEKVPEVFVLILPQDHNAAMEDLRLISALRANARARHTGIIVLQRNVNPELGAHALDLGADDLMTDGFDAAELALRIKSVLRRKRMGDQLRATVRTGLQAAVFDPLTGLYNRRYAMPHLDRISEHACTTGRKFAVMLGDLDHFKQINDAYGHASGDAVLVEVAHRLRQALRGTDMVSRIGGEEFLIIMPGTDLPQAQTAAVRICDDISGAPFIVPGNVQPIHVTISIGMTIGGADAGMGKDGVANSPKETGHSLLEEADSALYAAKGRGRNQVKLSRPAA
ncbi:Diguanylate cyclase response regulator [Sulfitobacter noctilucicola]|uniref:diguanylate cyclase n=1 Tax=Sulfitobacter noctilucicola TaxID=1342301 RepID=A0A7W6M8F5_9RHOB|nr:diguanylate cyclase [Sulfitobacter noctilucicola]KIN64452.1 Diguanylate cyclase response regulator [Sulfitobacter noctilucicola]MBB4174388.1 two-component system cell cycle response regulator [Sulfitobacter noctilucicola]